MKYIMLPIIVLATVVVFASKKSIKELPYDPQLNGEWAGAYSVADGPLVNELFFDFKEGRVISVYDGPKSWGGQARGSYTLTGDSLVGKFIYKDGVQSPVTIKAHIDRQKGELTGTWEWVKGKGVFQLTRTKPGQAITNNQ